MGEPRGLSHILNPSRPSGEVQQLKVCDCFFINAYEENGRYYHAWKRGTYPFPTDDRERSRYDMVHHLVYRVLLNHFSDPRTGDVHRDEHGRIIPVACAKPIVASQTPYSILDLGCGSGIWACDMGSRYPDAEITGVDIVGGQPRGENLTWRTPDSDAQLGIDFESAHWGLTGNSFDLIHAAHLCGSVSDWPRFFEKCKKHLRPKTGQIELLEIDMTPRCDDGSLSPDAPIHKWWRLMQDATLEKPIAYQADTGGMLHRAGFVDIAHTEFRLPFSGTWSPDRREQAAGQWYRNLLLEQGDRFDSVAMFNGLSMGPLTRNLGWAKWQVDQLVADVLRCIDDDRVHAYHTLHIWTARRPGSDENL